MIPAWIVEVLAELHKYIEQYIRPFPEKHEAIIHHPMVDGIAKVIYDNAKANPTHRPLLKQVALAEYGYELKWVTLDDSDTEDLIVIIDTPYGGVLLYRNAEAFREMGEMFKQAKPMIDEYNAAKEKGDFDGMERVQKEFAARVRLEKILGFLLTPFSMVYRGIKYAVKFLRR